MTAPVIPLPPPQILGDPAKIDAWYFNLSPIDRGRYSDHLLSLINAMPPNRRKLFEILFRHYNSGEPLPLTVGLGYTAAAGAFWGGLTAAALQTGVSIYNSREQAALQEDLASGNRALQKELAKIQAEAQAEAQKAMIGAQTDAARIAARSQVQAAQVAAGATVDVARVGAQQTALRYGFWDEHGTKLIIGGGAIIGAVVVTAIALRRRKGRK